MQENRGAVAPYQVGRPPASVVTPTAVAQAKPSATFALGEMLKTVIRNTRAFHTEAEEDQALNTIDQFVGAHVNDSDMNALRTGDEIAPREDVTKRTPPGGAVAPLVQGPAIDYMQLARAIAQVQSEQQAELAQQNNRQETGPQQ